MDWKLTPKSEIDKIIDKQYKNLSFKDKKAFNSVKITPQQAKIKRSENVVERVWLIAKLNDNYIFFEDIEETFCITTIDENNFINDDYADFGFYDFIFAAKELIKFY